MRSVDALPYDTLGSGSYAAMSVLEHRYKPDMEVCVVAWCDS